ncbi:MAG: universal stress protein [Thermoanaerobaculia bacterium]|nr:universal stress protein [Thermoanaerobaculia bacterium]
MTFADGEREGLVMPGTVFLGTDFSPASENAFLLALDEARLRSSVLVLAHVIPTEVLLDCAISEVAPLREICLKKLEALRRRAATSHVTARIELLDGKPHVSLVEAAARFMAELVVLGTRGRAGMSRLMFGSVALRVVCEAPCPVVVVRAAA